MLSKSTFSNTIITLRTVIETSNLDFFSFLVIFLGHYSMECSWILYANNPSTKSNNIICKNDRWQFITIFFHIVIKLNGACKIVSIQGVWILCFSYSGCRLMGSRLMLSISQCDQIYPDWQVPNNSFISNTRLSSFAYY